MGNAKTVKNSASLVSALSGKNRKGLLEPDGQVDSSQRSSLL